MEKLPFELTFLSYKTLPVNSDRPSFRYSHWLSIRNVKEEEWEISHVVQLKPTRWSTRTFVYVTLQECQQAYCIVVDGKDSIHRIYKVDMADLSLAMTERGAYHLGIDMCPISLTGDDERFGYVPVHGNKDKLMLIDRHVAMEIVKKAAEEKIKGMIDSGLFWTTPQSNTPPADDPSGQDGRNTQFSE